MLAGDASVERLTNLTRESARMAEYLGAHLDRARAARRTDPDAPMLHALAGGVEDGRISRGAAIGIATTMFGAGGESTAALLGAAARKLAEDPGTAQALREDPKRLSRFVDEVARIDPPFNFHYRVVRRDCALGGFELEAGDRLMLLWASANRDAARIEDPEWQAQWAGKQVADAEGNIVLDVVRGEADGPHEIDGIAGATLTSNGVAGMVAYWLGPHGYGPFLDRLAQEGL